MDQQKSISVKSALWLIQSSSTYHRPCIVLAWPLIELKPENTQALHTRKWTQDFHEH